MLKGITNFFKSNDDDLDLDAIDAKLDALEKAADERIAAKEARLKELTKNCDKTRRNLEAAAQEVIRVKTNLTQGKD